MWGGERDITMENMNDTSAKCAKCKRPLAATDRFCKYCGKKVEESSDKFSFEEKIKEEKVNYKKNGTFSDEKSEEASQSIFDKINDYVGNTGSKELNWKNLFSDVFKHHTTDEAEEIFICGTKKTTPALSNVSSTWPNPWLYSRVFVIFAIVFILLKICWECFNNINVVPGLIMVGSFAVPLTTLILFLEVNAFRNISLYQVVKYFLVGGCAALFVTLILYSMFLQPNVYNMTFFDACIIGIVEELAKAIIVFFILKHSIQYKYILNVLLIGAAVGAGFAAFESAGYAFVVLLNNLANGNAMEAMLDNIYLRGFMSPGGHVTWAAIAASAILLAKGDRPLELNLFFSGRFWKIFIIPVILHALWDTPIGLGQEIYLQYWLLFAAIWVIVLIFINMGLNEVKQINKSEL